MVQFVNDDILNSIICNRDAYASCDLEDNHANCGSPAKPKVFMTMARPIVCILVVVAMAAMTMATPVCSVILLLAKTRMPLASEMIVLRMGQLQLQWVPMRLIMEAGDDKCNVEVVFADGISIGEFHHNNTELTQQQNASMLELPNDGGDCQYVSNVAKGSMSCRNAHQKIFGGLAWVAERNGRRTWGATNLLKQMPLRRCMCACG